MESAFASVFLVFWLAGNLVIVGAGVSRGNWNRRLTEALTFNVLMLAVLLIGLQATK